MESDSVNDEKSVRGNAFPMRIYEFFVRCSWMLFGGMLMLMFMTEDLYLENQLYPYAAEIGAFLGFILSVVLETVTAKVELKRRRG